MEKNLTLGSMHWYVREDERVSVKDKGKATDMGEGLV